MHDNILLATVEDAHKLATLVNNAYRGETSKQGWTTEADLLTGTRTDADALTLAMKTPDTYILKYIIENIIVGCVELVYMEDKSLYVGMLTVRPDLQGKGIGKALLKAAEHFAKSKSVTTLCMTVISVRIELLAWYKRLGYNDIGMRKPFHFNDARFGIPKQKLEFIVLEKKLISFEH